MPSKLPRRRDAGGLVPSNPPMVVPMDPRTALILGGTYAAHSTIQAGSQVTSAAVTAAGRVLGASIESFGECFCAFVGYMREREITARVIAQELAETTRVQAWSDAVIADAEARTEEVRIQAALVLASIEDRKQQRESKLTVIQGFMSAYQRWNVMLTDALTSRVNQMSLDERELLQQHINLLLQRAKEMEHAITSIAATL